jgi:DNA-binding NarL/FixJ family response regulator
MDQQGTVRIVIADDHRMFIDGIQALLRKEKRYVFVRTALNGQEAFDFIAENEADLLITDISMPGMSGTELAKKVKQQCPQVKVLVVTMYNDPAIVNEILMSEAEGYILKNTGKEELVNAISRIIDNGTYYSREIMEVMMRSSIKQSKSTTPVLTARETEIVKLISQELTTADIAERLFISPRTVDTHRKNILEKTNSKTIVGLMKFAFSNNLI